ncbi:MAG: hypothetical protein M0Q91_16795 [Methanoregula sp.]|nr:hypothetical protein [Methanoregula sp.]
MKPYPHCKEGCRFTVDGKCTYREQHTPTIAVDFDRVLFEHESWQGHENVGQPIPGAKEALLELRKMGFRIMIWTTRDQVTIIQAALLRHDIPFDYINNNPNQPPEINPSKPVADYYIDDRALHFTSWEKALEEVKHREAHDPYYKPPSQENDMNVLDHCHCSAVIKNPEDQNDDWVEMDVCKCKDGQFAVFDHWGDGGYLDENGEGEKWVAKFLREDDAYLFVYRRLRDIYGKITPCIGAGCPNKFLKEFNIDEK